MEVADTFEIGQFFLSFYFLSRQHFFPIFNEKVLVKASFCKLNFSTFFNIQVVEIWEAQSEQLELPTEPKAEAAEVPVAPSAPASPLGTSPLAALPSAARHNLRPKDPKDPTQDTQATQDIKLNR